MKHIFNEVQYELTRKIAEGGMGMVYEATQRGIGGFRKVVAIKLIREEYSAIEEFRNNFIGEAKLVAYLIHTNIVKTYHLGKIGEQYFMTMEFVTGWNLEEFQKGMSKPTNTSPPTWPFSSSPICRGLMPISRPTTKEGPWESFIGRESENIMIAKEGDAKLTDFGIAKALDLMYNQEGVIAGKDEYLPGTGSPRSHGASRSFCCGIVMSELMLNEHLRGSRDAPVEMYHEKTIDNILNLPIPNFSEILGYRSPA